jgi:hypothetical protein
VEGSCEHGNELSGSIKFLGNPGVAVQLLKRGSAAWS